jgi:hypothetical protein
MQLDHRELTITQLVFRFGQLTSRHINELVFADSASHTPASRVLRRLVERNYLSRIERRIVGGSRGGSGVYVYQVGAEGHRLLGEGRWIPARAVRFHSLAIADCYVVLVRLARQGRLKLLGYTTEPECHIELRGYSLKPDLYVEVSKPDGSKTLRIMVEVDMATQGQRQILEKFLRYWRAREAADETEWPGNQIVAFIAIDDERAQELRWLREKGDKEQRELFLIKTLPEFEEWLTG